MEKLNEADLLNRESENKETAVAVIIDYLRRNNLVAVGVNTFLQPYIPWASMVQEAVARTNNPAILVNPIGAVNAVVNKLVTREAINSAVESLRWPAESAGRITATDFEATAVAAFRSVSIRTPTGKVVLKPVTGAAKAILRLGMGTEEEMRAAARSAQEELKYWEADAERGNLHLHSLDREMMVEGLLDALAEVDVELAISLLRDGSLDVLGFIIGNPEPGHLEKGYLFGMNGLLSTTLQRQLVVSAIEAVVAVWRKYGALPFGNVHKEMKLRGDPTDPKLGSIEINAPRPIGGNGVRLAREWHFEIDLIYAGLRAALGLPQVAPRSQPKDSFLALAATPVVSGRVDTITVPAGMPRASFSDFGREVALSKQVPDPIYVSLSDPGEEVQGVKSAEPGVLGAVVARGTDALDAVRRVLAAWSSVEYLMTTPNGPRVQIGSEEHSLTDYRALPQRP